jgi:hypothetical protein
VVGIRKDKNPGEEIDNGSKFLHNAAISFSLKPLGTERMQRGIMSPLAQNNSILFG